MRFYIDIYDGALMMKDDVGTNVRNFEVARREAIQTIRELANHELPDGEYRQFAAVVRNSDGVEVYRAELTFEGHLGGR